MTETSSTVLQTVLGELKNISPEVREAYVFKKDGEVLASIENALSEDRAKKAAAAFNDVANQAEIIDGVEVLFIQGANSQLNVAFANNRYSAIVSSRAADEKMVKSLTCVIIPTIAKLLDQLAPEVTVEKPVGVAKPEVEQVEEAVEPTEAQPNEPLPEPPAVSEEQVLPKAPVNQFMVEKIGGFMVASDVVRVDADVVAKWMDLYGDAEIVLVNIETLEGKSIICKFKPMKETDGNSKGIIQIPEKILQILRTAQGKLVMVKPVVPPPTEGRN